MPPKARIYEGARDGVPRTAAFTLFLQIQGKFPHQLRYSPLQATSDSPWAQMGRGLRPQTPAFFFVVSTGNASSTRTTVTTARAFAAGQHAEIQQNRTSKLPSSAGTYAPFRQP